MIDSAIDSFRKEKLKDLSKNTTDAYIRDIYQFLNYISNKVNEVSNEKIEGYKKHLMDKAFKAKTVNRKLVSIKKFFNYLNTMENFFPKVILEIKQIKIQKQDCLDDILETIELQRMADCAKEKNDMRAIALLWGLYLTGARVSELLQLKVRHLENKDDEVEIKGKGIKYRHIYIHDELREHINNYIKQRNHDLNDFVFINTTNNNPMSRQTVHNIIKFYAGLKRIKLKKAHAHTFRHMLGVRLTNEKVPIDQIADILGHSDVNTTRIYTRLTKKELKNVIKNLK